MVGLESITIDIRKLEFISSIIKVALIVSSTKTKKRGDKTVAKALRNTGEENHPKTYLRSQVLEPLQGAAWHGSPVEVDWGTHMTCDLFDIKNHRSPWRA